MTVSDYGRDLTDAKGAASDVASEIDRLEQHLVDRDERIEELEAEVADLERQLQAVSA